jgi:RimJ/RimL family protein N-acetyltransferase
MKINLRKWRETDLDSLIKYADNSNIAKWMRNVFPNPYTAEDAKSYLKMRADEHPAKIFAIEVNGEAVGSIGIFPQTDIYEKNAEIGYWLAEEYWGKGIMPKAIQEMIEYGFRTFDIVRIFASVFSENLKSQRVLEKAGFTFEATLKKSVFKNGEFMDEMIYVKFKENEDRI